MSPWVCRLWDGMRRYISLSALFTLQTTYSCISFKSVGYFLVQNDILFPAAEWSIPEEESFQHLEFTDYGACDEDSCEYSADYEMGYEGI